MKRPSAQIPGGRVALLVGILCASVCPLADAQTTGQKKGQSRPGATRPTTRPDSSKDRPAPEVLDLKDFHLKPNKEWKERPLAKASAMRRAQLILPGPKDLEDGEIIVYYFGKGGAGSAEQNITRWKGMFARPHEMPQEEFAQKKELEVDGMTVTTLAVRGSYVGPSFARLEKPKHEQMMLTAVVPTEGGTYYLRALGPQKTLEHWAKAWDQMIKGMKKGPAAAPDGAKKEEKKGKGW